MGGGEAPNATGSREWPNGRVAAPDKGETKMADGDAAPDLRPDKKPLSRDTSRLGNSFIFPPHVIDDIHIKSELGRYRMRGF